jgi:hypothetical protein
MHSSRPIHLNLHNFILITIRELEVKQSERSLE